MTLTVGSIFGLWTMQLGMFLSAVVAVLLMRTCACGDTSVPVFLAVPLATIVCQSTPVGDAWGVIWLFFSVVGAESHGLLRSLSVGLFDGQRAS